MSYELTANQRLRQFINEQNISQIEFSQRTCIEKSKVSNFLKWPRKGGTEFPRIDFFQHIDPIITNENADECSICLSSMDDIVVTECGHLFCKECIQTCIMKSKKACPN